jgi:hypothetical protein
MNPEVQPQVPFDYAQGRLSTPLVAKSATNFAQVDSFFLILALEHHTKLPGRMRKASAHGPEAG